MVMFRMMTWDLEKFGKFQEAMDDAVRFGHGQFTVDFGRPTGELTFRTDEAVEMEGPLAAQFAANPQPVFGENREGEEP